MKGFVKDYLSVRSLAIVESLTASLLSAMAVREFMGRVPRPLAYN